jgi:hypothetical protein
MFVKLLCAAALVAAPVSAPATPQFVLFPMVKMVDCGTSRGTAFYADNRLISASHVTESACFVDGVFLKQTHEDGLDFSSEPSTVSGYKINCEGFKDGETYFAVGFAHGLPVQRLIVLTGTGQKADNGMALLWGAPTVIPGMSGGPIINMKAEVVGQVNMYSIILPVSLSREMKDTSLCEKS